MNNRGMKILMLYINFTPAYMRILSRACSCSLSTRSDKIFNIFNILVANNVCYVNIISANTVVSRITAIFQQKFFVLNKNKI